MATVKNLILSSERCLCGNEIGEVVQFCRRALSCTIFPNLKAFYAKRLLPAVPEFSFCPETTSCSRCGNETNVLKTAKRTAVTVVIGNFVARETQLRCPRRRETVRCED